MSHGLPYVLSQLGEVALYGDPEPRGIVAGQSNVRCFLDSLRDSTAPDSVREGFAVGFTAPNSAKASGTSRDYWQMVFDCPSNEVVFIVWQGNQHNASFLIESSPFSVVSSSRAMPPVEGPVIPRRAVESFYEESLRPLDGVLEMLTKTVRCVLVGTPPPKSSARVKASFSAEPFFARQAEAMGLRADQVQIAPLSLRVVLWEVLQDCLHARAKHHGVQLIPVPDWVMGEDGRLLDEYCADDVSHANASYAEALWPLLKAELDA